MKEVLICFVLALVIGAAMNGLSTLSPGASTPTSAASTEQPTSATTEEADGSDSSSETAVADTDQDKFDAEVLSSAKPVLVDFYADWCGPCKQMSPIVQKLASQYADRLQVYKVNIDRNPRLVAKYNIQSIPTFMIFKNGASADSFAGSMPRSELAAAIEKHLN